MELDGVRPGFGRGINEAVSQIDITIVGLGDHGDEKRRMAGAE